MNKSEVKIQKIAYSTKLPTRGTKGAAGYDIYSPITVEILPGKIVSILTGVAFEIPKGTYLNLVPRSSMGKKGIIIPNSPATIDEDYRGEVTVMLFNIGDSPYTVREGDRIAQIILLPYLDFNLTEVNILSETERGHGGFGSTGR